MNRESQQLRDLVGAYLVDQCTVIIEAEASLRAGENVVHVTRVGVRRLRSTLRVFAELFDIPLAGQLEDELVWWASVLGEVRDLDVLGARLTEAVAELPPELVLGPVQSHLQTEVGVRRKVASDLVIQALDTDRYRELVATVQRWRSDIPFTDSADQGSTKISFYLRRAGRKVRKRLADAVAADQAGDAGAAALLHRARKAGKRHRYAVELAAPVLGSKAEKTIATLKDLQDVLGGHQDSIVTADFLRVVGAQVGVAAGHNGFTYGLLYARELEARHTLTHRLKPFLR